MGNYEAIAYAFVALEQLKKEGVEVNSSNLRGRMLHLMDLYSESEIYEMYSEGTD